MLINPVNLKKLFIFIAIVSWFLLLGNLLMQQNRGNITDITGSTADYFYYICQAVFMLAVFAHQRISVNAYKAADLTDFLWRLFIRAGTTAYVCIGLFLGYKLFLSSHADTYYYLLETIHAVNFALFTYFIAKAFYTWQRLIFFQKTKTLILEWRWFEIFLFATVILSFFPFELINFILIPLIVLLALYLVFLCLRLNWVAYLVITKKWRYPFALISHSG